MTALVLDIVTTAAILFAVASGLLIILGVLKIVNFAHGAFLTIGGYSARGDAAWLERMVGPSVGGRGGGPDGSRHRTLCPTPALIGPRCNLATWGLGIIIGQLITIAGRGFSLCRRSS
jgi:branched-chain amino acid transport system permease protein